MVSLVKGRTTAVPLAGQAQIVLSLATNVRVFDMIIEDLSVVEAEETRVPLADIVV
jgi:hypothetical protein